MLIELGAPQASIQYLDNIRSIVRQRAETAGLRDPDSVARSWHILMKGSIISAAEGLRLQRLELLGRVASPWLLGSKLELRVKVFEDHLRVDEVVHPDIARRPGIGRRHVLTSRSDFGRR